MPVHAIVPLRNALGRARRSRSSSCVDQLVGARGSTPTITSFCCAVALIRPAPEPFGEVGDQPELVPGDPAGSRREPHRTPGRRAAA